MRREPRLVLERDGMAVKQPIDAVDVIKNYLVNFPTEHFIALPLSEDHKVMRGLYEIAEGSQDEVDPGDPAVWMKMFKDMGASVVITAHNHPSVKQADGKETSMASPSTGDFASYMMDQKAAAQMGLDVHIHIIVGPAGDTTDIGHIMYSLDEAKFQLKIHELHQRLLELSEVEDGHG